MLLKLTVMDLPKALVCVVLSAIFHALVEAHLRELALKPELEPLDAQVRSVLRQDVHAPVGECRYVTRWQRHLLRDYIRICELETECRICANCPQTHTRASELAKRGHVLSA